MTILLLILLGMYVTLYCRLVRLERQDRRIRNLRAECDALRERLDEEDVNA